MMHLNFVRKCTFCVLALFVFPLVNLAPAGPVPAGKPAAYPAWWFERDVIRRTDPNKPAPVWPADYPAVDDFTVVNQGQLKYIASRAAAELNVSLAPWGGAGSAIDALLLPWSAPGGNRDDYAAVNQGQLKSLAKLFHERLIAVKYASAYPWSADVNDDDNYSAANIGQVKYLFKFDLTLDVDNGGMGDGLPDWWERLIADIDPNDGITTIDDVLPGDDFDHDGTTNGDEYGGGTSPILPNGPDTDADGMVDATEPSRGAQVGLKDHPMVKLQFRLQN